MAAARRKESRRQDKKDLGPIIPPRTENSLISPVPSIFEANSGNSSPMGNKAPARKNRTPSGPLPQVCQAAAASHPNKIHRLDTFSHLISIIMEISEKNTQNPPENVI